MGAACAFAVLFVVRSAIQGLVNSHQLELIHDLVVSTREVEVTGLFILFVGAGIGAIGSALAVRRFLDV